MLYNDLMMRKFIVILTFIFLLLPGGVFAQNEPPAISLSDETLEAIIIKVVSEKEVKVMGQTQLQQKMELKVTKGSIKDKTIQITSGELPAANIPKYQEGDEVQVVYSRNESGRDLFYISDYVRRNTLTWLFVIFVIMTILIGKWQGASSILGMGVSFVIIFKFILPQISGGANPILIAILGSMMIIPVTFYLSHGLNRKTTVAIFGTIISLIITGLIAAFFIEAAKLTGFASEEASYLQTQTQGSIPIKGLLLAGIIIGALGILDDITVSQAAIVFELKKTNKQLGFIELFQKTMNIGRDHISSVVNTLVLVYTGAALPLLLLFINSPRPYSEVVNNEIIAEEIVRTLVGSIGLVLAVPITTLIAAYSNDKLLYFFNPPYLRPECLRLNIYSDYSRVASD